MNTSDEISEIGASVKAATEPLSTNKEESSSTSSSHSFDSSSSSSNSLSDEEIEFGQIQLHMRERNVVLNTPNAREAMLKLLQNQKKGVDGSVVTAAGNENAGVGNYPAAAAPQDAKSGGIVRILRRDHKVFEKITKEEAIEQCKKGLEVVIECSGYKKKDVKFFMEALKLNAILYWELLTMQTPDKYQCFGSTSSLLIMNYATNLEKMIIERKQPIKVVRLHKVTLIFASNPLDMKDILPDNSIEELTGDTLLYLILQRTINQYEETTQELRMLVGKVHSESSNIENISQRGTFVETMGELSRLLAHMDGELKVKQDVLKEIGKDEMLQKMFRVKLLLVSTLK